MKNKLLICELNCSKLADEILNIIHNKSENKMNDLKINKSLWNRNKIDEIN
jgi:hypothetical protein